MKWRKNKSKERKDKGGNKGRTKVRESTSHVLWSFAPFTRPSRCLHALRVFAPCGSSGALHAVCTPCGSSRHPFYGSGLAVVGASRLPFLPLLVFLLFLVFAMRPAGLDACGHVHCLPLLPSVGCCCLQLRLLQVAVACPSHVGVRPVLPSVRRVFTPCSLCSFSRIS